jgi:hypothetical protein
MPYIILQSIIAKGQTAPFFVILLSYYYTTQYTAVQFLPYTIYTAAIVTHICLKQAEKEMLLANILL